MLYMKWIWANGDIIPAEQIAPVAGDFPRSGLDIRDWSGTGHALEITRKNNWLETRNHREIEAVG